MYIFSITVLYILRWNSRPFRMIGMGTGMRVGMIAMQKKRPPDIRWLSTRFPSDIRLSPFPSLGKDGNSISVQFFFHPCRTSLVPGRGILENLREWAVQRLVGTVQLEGLVAPLQGRRLRAVFRPGKTNRDSVLVVHPKVTTSKVNRQNRISLTFLKLKVFILLNWIFKWRYVLLVTLTPVWMKKP